MKAFRFVAPGKTELVEIARPEPSDDEVLIRVQAAGVCHSDIHIIHAPAEVGYPLPMTLGHEIAGTVEVVGSGVEGFQIGQQVAVYGPIGCGHCSACMPGADGKPLPQLASVAQQAGRYCAKSIATVIAGEPAKPFEHVDRGIMAMIGRNAAVAEVGAHRHELTGPLAFAAWLGVHAALLTTANAKIEALLEWVWDYFGNAHVDRILDRPEQMNIDLEPGRDATTVSG